MPQRPQDPSQIFDDDITALPAERGDRGERAAPPARGPLDREERAIKDTLLRMGSVIEEAIRRTIDALETHDAAMAISVIEGDRLVNEMAISVLEDVVRTIATQSPVARDLRYLLTLDHIGNELERIGDNAANVAKRARDLAPEPPLAGYVGLPEMGRLAADLLADVVRALIDADDDLARAVAARDDAIDTLYHRATDHLVELAKDSPDNVDRAARLLIAAHYLERIGDRVTNIAEDVVFLVTAVHEDLN